MRSRRSFHLLALLALALHVRAQATVPPPPTTPAQTTAPPSTTLAATTNPSTPTPVVDDDGDLPLETPAGAPVDILDVKAGQTVVLVSEETEREAVKAPGGRARA